MAPEIHNVERNAESRILWRGTPWPDDQPMPKWTDKDTIQNSATGKGDYWDNHGGAAPLDQAFHIGCLFAVALIITAGA